MKKSKTRARRSRSNRSVRKQVSVRNRSSTNRSLIVPHSIKRKTRRMKAGFETSWQNDPDVGRVCTSQGYPANSFTCKQLLEKEAMKKMRDRYRPVQQQPTFLQRIGIRR